MAVPLDPSTVVLHGLGGIHDVRQTARPIVAAGSPGATMCGMTRSAALVQHIDAADARAMMCCRMLGRAAVTS